MASGSGSELILFDLRLLKPEEASSVKSNRGLLVLEALLPLPNFEWKAEDGRGHVTAFLVNNSGYLCSWVDFQRLSLALAKCMLHIHFTKRI